METTLRSSQGALTRAIKASLCAAVMALGLFACGGDNRLPAPAQPKPDPATYAIGGTVAGLGGGVVVLANAGEELAVGANGAFVFPTRMTQGSRYAVTVQAQPGSRAQTCTVNRGSASVAGADVDDIAVICSINSYTVGGTVSGLKGSGLVLQNNAGDDLAIAADGSFSFSQPVASGAAYAVTVRQQPRAMAQTCQVERGSGTIGAAAVSDVALNCAAPTPRFAYIANQFADTVSAYAIDAGTGALSAVPGSPFAAGPQPLSVTLHPNGRFAYVAGASEIRAYSVDAATGALALLPGSPYAEGLLASLSIEPGGRFAYAASPNSNIVRGYAIDADSGALTAVPGSPFAAGTAPFGITVDPGGRFVYAANGSSHDISAYAIDAATGALQAVPGSPFATGAHPMTVAIDPLGRFAYVPNDSSNSVSAYAIDAATGALSPVAGSPFASGEARPFWATVDPRGSFVYAPHHNTTGRVTAYAVDPSSGALNAVAGSPFAAGNLPATVTVDPSGAFAYVGNLNANSVSVYPVDAVSGALGTAASFAVSSPRSIAILGR